MDWGLIADILVPTLLLGLGAVGKFLHTLSVKQAILETRLDNQDEEIHEVKELIQKIDEKLDTILFKKM